MSERTFIKVFTSEDVLKAMINQTLLSQGIEYDGPIRYFATGEAGKTLRLEVTIDTDHIIKTDE